MFKILKKLHLARMVAVTLVCSVGLAACQTTSGGSNLTTAERQLRQTETKRLAQGVLSGAAVGAVVTGLITAAAGGSAEDIVRNAAIGGAVGGVGGGLYANNVNNRTRGYAQQQQNYKGLIAQADANISSYGRMASAASQVSADEARKIARLNTQLQQGAITKAQYRSELSSARANIRLIERQIDNAQADVASLNTAIQNGAPGSVVSRRNQLQSRVSLLTQRLGALKQTYNRVPDSVGLGI